ncbi:MAG TPA: hypothetical protein VHO06_25505 [Polyangia bacterium]|nr:hypothetical protein [Polyangia bacterium]
MVTSVTQVPVVPVPLKTQRVPAAHCSSIPVQSPPAATVTSGAQVPAQH